MIKPIGIYAMFQRDDGYLARFSRNNGCETSPDGVTWYFSQRSPSELQGAGWQEIQVSSESV